MSRADGRVFRALTMGGKAGLIMLLGKERKSMARSGELAVSIGKAQRRENGLSTAHTEAEARLLSELRSRRAVLAPPPGRGPLRRVLWLRSGSRRTCA